MISDLEKGKVYVEPKRVLCIGQVLYRIEAGKGLKRRLLPRTHIPAEIEDRMELECRAWPTTSTITKSNVGQAIRLSSTPIFSISTSTTSPDLRKTGGVRLKPTPGGVPVRITSPGSRVM